jgi:hypothetical protein
MGYDESRPAEATASPAEGARNDSSLGTGSRPTSQLSYTKYLLFAYRRDGVGCAVPASRDAEPTALGVGALPSVQMVVCYPTESRAASSYFSGLCNSPEDYANAISPSIALRDKYTSSAFGVAAPLGIVIDAIKFTHNLAPFRLVLGVEDPELRDRDGVPSDAMRRSVPLAGQNRGPGDPGVRDAFRFRPVGAHRILSTYGRTNFAIRQNAAAAARQGRERRLSAEACRTRRYQLKQPP